MKNQMTRDLLVDSIKMDDELYHHGILGMSWGDRHGPPYPLSGSAKKIARAEAKKKIEQQRRLEKAREAAAKKRKEKAREAKRQEKIDKKKAKILAKNDMNALYKNKKLFTTEEIRGAVERNQAVIEAKYSPDAKNAPDPRTMDKLLNIVNKLGMAASAAKPMVDLAKSLSELDRSSTQKQVDEINRRDKAFQDRYNMLRQSSPEAAIEYLNKQWGTNYKYETPLRDKLDLFSALQKRIDDENKKSPPDQRVIQTLMQQQQAIKF